MLLEEVAEAPFDRFIANVSSSVRLRLFRAPVSVEQRIIVPQANSYQNSSFVKSVDHYDNYEMMMMKIIMRSGVDMALSSEGQILTTSD